MDERGILKIGPWGCSEYMANVQITTSFKTELSMLNHAVNLEARSTHLHVAIS